MGTGVLGVNFFSMMGDLLVVVIGVVFFFVTVVVMIFLLVVLGWMTGEAVVVVVVERVVVERCLGLDVVEEVVDSVISILLVDGGALDDAGSKLHHKVVQV